MTEALPVTVPFVRLRAPGGPEQFAIEEAGRPRSGPGEVLVRVDPAAITREEIIMSSNIGGKKTP